MNSRIGQRKDKKIQLKVYSQLDYYGMSKQTLIKHINILVHQLKIYYRLGQFQHQQFSNKTSKSQVQKQILVESYQKNQEKLRSKVDGMDHNLQQMKLTIKEKEKQIAKLYKQVEVYRKKAENFDKIGGKNKVSKLEEMYKQLKEKKNQLQDQNRKLRKQVLELKNRSKILEKLNQQTQLKVAQQMIFDSRQTKSQYLIDEQQNNPNLVNKTKVKENNIEFYALKEQVKELREKLRLSEENRQKLKAKMNERQIFYSKMIQSSY